MLDQTQTLPGSLGRGIADLFPSGIEHTSDSNLHLRLEESFKTKKPLRIKLGIDPTAKDIHLGHSILFRKLRAFQDAGHTAILIIGDFTARIGDPTGKSKTRVQLTSKIVEENAKTYLEQLGSGKNQEESILDFATPGRLEVHRNSEWLRSLDLNQIIELMSCTTVGQMLAKEDFAKRYSTGIPIALHEFLYPLLQGYDSVAVRSDLELGGTDQKFNIAMGRDLQKAFNQRPQFGLLLPILVGLDGVQKMSKSLGNTVGLNEDAISMYSKLEKLPDELVDSYLMALTNLDLQNLPKDPRIRQKEMALAITSSRHGIVSAKLAQENAAKLVAGNQKDINDIPKITLNKITFPVKAFYLLSALNLSPSSSEARRQIKGGSVRLDGQKIEDPNTNFNKEELSGKIIQIGKKLFRRLIP
tara:strand:- start:187 stop:1431 length:1245 start_codon:yes stop_codon:yes gene_type:complete